MEQSASTQPAEAPGTVADTLRAELAALSSNFAEENPVSVSPALPFPDGITNTVTHFLALDKCEPNKDFLQLLEIGSLSAPDRPISRPVKLNYDPEWLAILRVFAPELSLGGSPNNRVPQHRGETFCRERIVEEEEWVEENVVRRGKLAVPEDFTVTAPVYDAEVEAGMPREVTNPQTTTFCGLVGIECLFEASEEERTARMDAGARGESAGWRGRGGARGGRGGGRGGRGRGRGGRGRGRGGRGSW
jgi:lariat debranching enzyme